MVLEHEGSALRALAERWWVPIVRGCAAIAFGIAVLVAPGIGLYALVLLWGAYALVDGIANFVLAARSTRPPEGRGWLVLEGIVSVAAGLVALAWPGITALALLWVIAAWAVITGVAEVAASVRLRHRLRHAWLLALAGVLSVVVGVLLFAYPGTGALAVLWTIGAYALAFGIILVGFGLRLKSAQSHLRRDLPPGATPSPA